MPSWTLTSICKAVACLLETPNPDSPLNCDAGNLLRNGDRAAYEQMAELYTREEAIPVEAFKSAWMPAKVD
jgi:peroxin-4